MRRSLAVVVLTLATLACKKEAPAPAPMAQPAAAAPAANVQILRGKVLEKIDVSQYSYLRLSTASGETWAAVQRTDKKVGDEVGVVNAFPMQGFESKELNRKFDVVYFGSLASGQGAEPAGGPGAAATAPAAANPMAQGMPPGGTAEVAAQHQMVANAPTDVKVEKVSKASGAEGRTVAEIWAQREKLAGKTVAVRGTVVKFTPVMGKNFLHLRDGSGSADKKDNDVTITTSDNVAVGDVVTAKGTVIVDKDFGSGYAYPVLLDNAKVTK
jgi:hypothetical protein